MFVTHFKTNGDAVSRRKGVALGSVLLCLAVLVALLFIVVSASLSHLNLVTAVGRREHARNLAESALARGLEELIATDYAFGRDEKDRVVVTFAGLQDAEGIVTFNKKEFAAGYSTFNLDSDRPLAGAGGLNVPPEAVHLVARGRVGEIEQWMECVYHRPPYPDGLVGTGWIEASGLVLTGVKKGEDYEGGDPASVLPEDKTPANLFANALSGPKGPSVILGPGCDINGSVGSRGAIRVDSSNMVKGEILPNSERRPIPALNIRTRISELVPNAVGVFSTSGALTLDKSWFSQASGDLLVGGDLDLNGSALCVEGDLTVDGAIKGTGVILATGSVEVNGGGSKVVSSDQVALAAGGDVRLRGSNPAGNFFQGLVYTEGDLEADSITVVGAAIANGKSPGKGNVTLNNVKFVKTPTSVQITLTRMKGFPYGGRSGALSITLKPAPDGKSYLADVRAAFTIDSDAKKAAYIDNPILWKGLGDKPAYRTWESINVGEPGPDFGRQLGNEIGRWVRDYAEGESKWVGEFTKLLPQELNSMVDDQPGAYEISFSLNNLMAEEFGESRILLWREFER